MMNKEQLATVTLALHEAFSDEAVILIDGNTITVEFEDPQLRAATITSNLIGEKYEVDTLDRRGPEDHGIRLEKVTIEEIVGLIKQTLLN